MRSGRRLVLLLLFLSGCDCAPSALPNFAVVDAGRRIYRGAEPTPEGWKLLAHTYGVTNVVKLNTAAEGSDSVAVALGLEVQEFPITTQQQIVGPLDDTVIRRAVAAITAGTFIHCGSEARTDSQISRLIGNVGGQDRTGLVCACYRVQMQGWRKADAEKEMLAQGFHRVLHGLHEYWEHFQPAEGGK